MPRLISWPLFVAIGTSAQAFASPPVRLAPAATQSRAQSQPLATEEVQARVTKVLQGKGIIMDRGTRDGLRAGDRVTFTERGGRQQFGTILELEDRVATVRPEDPSFAPSPGTRAAVVVPSSRFAPAPNTGAGTVKVPVRVPGDSTGSKQRSPKPGTKADGNSWTRPDDGFTMDMPLLAEVNAVPPSKRASKLTGRTYFSLNHILDSEDDRGDTFGRLGGSVYGSNLFGKGGTFHMDGELNARRTAFPDEADESESNLRLDRLSYTLGGDRHDWNRVQFGRFLQSDMSEFGVLDGVSWGTRFDNGDSFGASFGFLPEPDKDQESFEDLQVAAWYRWVADEREILSFTGGVQKTWHNGSADRDLMVLKTQYNPAEGWNVFGSAWVDLYGSGDDAKGSGPELTYMLVDARKQFENGLNLDLDYRHQAYPELLRSEFPQTGLQQIQDAHVDRFGATVSKWTRGGSKEDLAKRLYMRVGGWVDEDDSGGDAELGVDVLDLFTDDGRLDVAVFASEAKFSSTVGARVRYGRSGPDRSWSVQYEIRQNEILGFENDADSLFQHRLRGHYEFFRQAGFSASFTGEVQFQDREEQLFLGLFLQRSF